MTSKLLTCLPMSQYLKKTVREAHMHASTLGFLQEPRVTSWLLRAFFSFLRRAHGMANTLLIVFMQNAPLARNGNKVTRDLSLATREIRNGVLLEICIAISSARLGNNNAYRLPPHV